ncbi:MAG: leucine-rich repeat domain-containing protein [Bacteroidaceae bacterium]|nr:leucine-rich repeat domain-containing protein [Bacteroidaceae bacterium]
METKLLTEVFLTDFSEAICDEYGFYYSRDYKRLLSYKNPYEKQDKMPRNLKKIIINPKTKIICEDAFRNCKAYEKYIVSHCSGSYQACGLEIKFDNDNKTELVLPDGLEVIGKNAFTNSCFYKITIPKTVKTIYGNPFSYSDITIIKNLSPFFELENGILYTQTKDSLIHCFTQLESFISNSRTTIISDSAFASQQNLRTVILSNVKEIGDKVFYNCPNLEYISLPDKLEKIGVKAFKQKVASPHFSEDEREYYLDTRKRRLRNIPLEIVIPANTKYIGKEAFACISKIQSKSRNYIINDNLLLSTDGKVIYNCLGGLKTIAIPESVECIMGCAFEGIQSIERLIIPPNIKYIGNEAFRYCYNLKSVYFETNDIELGKSVFSDCISLKYITLPNNIKEIPERTFNNCPSIDSIVLPNTIVRIGEYAFDECSFHELSMPKELRIIEKCAFQGCNNLKTIILNEKLEEIGSFAFSDSDKVEELYIPKNVQKIGTYAFNIQKKVTISNTSMQMGDYGVGRREHELIIQIPTRYVRDMKCHHEIKEYWHIVPSFKEWTLAERLSGKDMGEYRHMHYDEYGHPVIDVSKPGTYSGDMECFISLFDNYSSNCVNKIALDKRVKYICNNAFKDYHNTTSKLKSVIIPDTTIAIGDYAFEDTELNKLDLPDNLEHIGNFAFKDSIIKEKLIIPKTVSHIGTNPFANTWQKWYYTEVECLSPNFKIIDSILYTSDMKRLIYCFNHEDYIKVPETVVSIDDYAFSQLPLKSISIPFSVKQMGKSAFDYCRNLETININNVSVIGEGCFSGCKSLKKIVMPYSELVNAYMFNHCDNLKSVIINEHTQIIGEGAFKDCHNLTKLVLPKNVMQIGESAFVGSGIKNILCETSYFEVKDNILYTKGLRTLICSFNRKSKIVIPEGVVEISKEAFAGRKEMKSIQMPSSLQILGERVFSGCRSLELIDLRKTEIKKLDTYTLTECKSDPKVLIKE